MGVIKTESNLNNAIFGAISHYYQFIQILSKGLIRTINS